MIDVKGKCENRKDYIHCEVEGAIINIREGLHDAFGRKVTSIEMLPDEYAGEPKWQTIPQVGNVRVVQVFERFKGGVRELPKVQIGGKLYFRDDRLEEFRSMDRPSDKPIKFEELGAYATGKEVRVIFGTKPER